MEFMTGPTKQASLVQKFRLQPVLRTECWCPLSCLHTQVSKFPIPQGRSISIFGRPEHVTLVESSRLQAVFPYFIVVSRPNNVRPGKLLHWRHSCSIIANAKKWAWKYLEPFYKRLSRTIIAAHNITVHQKTEITTISFRLCQTITV